MRPLLAYDYLFYKLYRWSNYLYRYDGAAFNSFHSTLKISLLLFMNVLSFFYFLQAVFDHRQINVPARIIYVGLGLALFLANYFYFIRRRRYLAIVAQFRAESNRMAKLSTTLVFAYFFCSFVLFIVSSVI
jgi:hypothetical protein